MTRVNIVLEGDTVSARFPDLAQRVHRSQQKFSPKANACGRQACSLGVTSLPPLGIVPLGKFIPETTRVHGRLIRARRFLARAWENVIIGGLIPAGTGILGTNPLIRCSRGRRRSYADFEIINAR